MQVVVPMSGFGERFRAAGYIVPKPLIEVDGRPVIAHVIDMFPGETDFLFVCNEDHLATPEYRMRETLEEHCPSGRIVGIPAHKLGPVHAVRQVEAMLDPEAPVVVNYCDFTCYWDWGHFREFVQTTGCDGAIPAYKGFHPHSLGNTNYAYMREQDGWVLDIQEKQPYTDNRMEEYASSGTYYFSSARLMSHAFKSATEQQLLVGGEFYASLAYKPLLADGLPVAVYPLQHFMQWGTPEDLAEYRYWSDSFQLLAREAGDSPAPQGSMIVPMAGLGQRFVDEGYTTAKPLLPVSGRPMVAQATRDLPPARLSAFVVRRDMPGYDEIVGELGRMYPNAVIHTLDHVTDGQACTAMLGLDALEEIAAPAPGPITFGACDNGAVYDAAAFRQLADDPAVDVIVWGIRGYPNAARHPQMFGWVDAEDGRIRGVSVKTPLASPERDPVVLGTFTFRRAEDFRRAVDRLVARGGRIGGEFYIDSCINDAIEMGLDCRLFEVDSYLCWGTPNDLRTYEYWQSCFHKWPSHPYTLALDSRVHESQLACLESKYSQTVPGLPGPRP